MQASSSVAFCCNSRHLTDSLGLNFSLVGGGLESIEVFDG